MDSTRQAGIRANTGHVKKLRYSVADNSYELKFI